MELFQSVFFGVGNISQAKEKEKKIYDLFDCFCLWQPIPNEILAFDYCVPILF